MSINRKIFSSLRWRISFAYLILIGIGFLVTNISILKAFENRQLYEKQERFRAYALQVAQVIGKDYASPDADIKANVVFTIEEIGDDIMYHE